VTAGTYDAETAAQSIVGVHQSNDSWGMGVFIGRGMIVTAAHILPRMPNPNMTLDGDVVSVNVRRFGRPEAEATVELASIDPCADIAVLRFDGCDHAEFEESLTAAPVAVDVSAAGRVLVHLLTHEGEWLDGWVYVRGRRVPRHATAQFDDPKARVRSGTSGAPAFDGRGRVVGIVSSSPIGRPEAEIVVLAAATPAWVLFDLRPDAFDM